MPAFPPQAQRHRSFRAVTWRQDRWRESCRARKRAVQKPRTAAVLGIVFCRAKLIIHDIQLYNMYGRGPSVVGCPARTSRSRSRSRGNPTASATCFYLVHSCQASAEMLGEVLVCGPSVDTHVCTLAHAHVRTHVHAYVQCTGGQKTQREAKKESSKVMKWCSQAESDLHSGY